MIRARFNANPNDPRPVNWPIKHPYWITGYAGDESYSTVVAYADNVEEININWPDAENIAYEEVDKYVFSGRFPRPKWFKGGE